MNKELKHKLETLIDPDRMLKCQYCGSRPTCFLYKEIPQEVRKSIADLPKKYNSNFNRAYKRLGSSVIPHLQSGRNYFVLRIIGECVRHRMSDIVDMVHVKKGVRID